MQITRQTLIGEIVENHPELIEILLSYGVHCVGCHVSPFESLEDGFYGHGISDEEIDEAVVKLNKAAAEQATREEQKEETGGERRITLTKAAIQKIKDFCQEEGKKALRIAVIPGGCSGYEYQIELADNAKENERIIQQEGAVVYITKASLEKINGATVDYKNTLTDAGFKIINPLATSTCGCGSSFS